jgi:hypothetical protein
MSTTPRIAQSISSAIQQRVLAGFNFNGTEPAGDAPLDQRSRSMYRYGVPPGVGGGLFFWNNVESLVCSQIHVDLGAAADITVSIVNLDPATWPATPTILPGESIVIEQATGARFIALDEARFKTILLPYQAIQITTTNSTADQIAQVVASLEKTYVR